MSLRIRNAAKLIRARLRGERGFTMPATLAVMMGVVGFSGAAIAVATSDFGGTSYNSKTKQAVAAAEAGIADYLYHLNQDNAYWSKCTSVDTPNAVNQVRSDIKTGATVNRRFVPGTANSADYALELLPANGRPSCDTSDAAGSMIDTPTGTFRIRSTGRVKTNTGGYSTRQLTATFKRRSFLDFLYFTDYETSDPAWYKADTYGFPTRTPSGCSGSACQDLVSWASANCGTYWKDGRDNFNFNGEIFYNNSWTEYDKKCNRIQFAPGDRINGPLHTNDDLYVCGSPTFGRTSQDKIEVSGQTDGTPGWRAACGGASPNFLGTFNPTALKLTLPSSNTKLKQIVDPAYKFTGRTDITLNGANMQVTNAARGLSNATMALPSNGVIYVEDGSCGQTYDPLNPYGAPAGCGDVYLKGTYSKDLTIAAEKDIVIRDDVKKSGDFVLGLIANQFVRVYHPLVAGQCENDTANQIGSVQIDAAILALQHSFTVDNYYCGDPLGTLTVNGVIAQKFRGPVGTGGSSISTGYLKDYNYDDRLQLRQPPYFLDPVQSSWRIQRQTE